MRLLLFSDVHCNSTYCDGIMTKARHADIAVGAGDYASFRRGLENIITCLSHISIPTVLIPGNHETHDELTAACRQWKNVAVLHGTATCIRGITFFGVGGATPETPFGPWSVDISEATAAEMLSHCPDRSVLVTHSPPRGCLDIMHTGRHMGSHAVRSCIETAHPMLSVCGHIHECGGEKDIVTGVPVVNAGPDGYVYTLPDR